MQKYGTSFWKTAPFVRILLPLITGILLQYYCRFFLSYILVCLSAFLISFILCYYLSLSLRYSLAALQGLLLNLLILSFAALLTWKKDVRHAPTWYGQNYTRDAKLIVRITEPPLEKTKSFKAEAVMEKLIVHDTVYNAKGKIILYFPKKDSGQIPRYGDRILIDKPLQPIKNSGNPGAFDYERYSAFQQIFHTNYLRPGEFIFLNENEKNFFDGFIFSTRDYILKTVKKYLSGDSNVTGIAEALLIGYKEDLDKNLVQAYSNTGVVHIIAISGLHLGLIYVMLEWLLNIIPLVKRSKLLKIFLLLGCLWIFSLLTGASASVLRSAVMFTCIVVGKNYFKQATIYNSLATSAVLLLCFDPYYLWDVGFQLSYFAVYGIVWLQQPIYHLLYINNKLINKVWQMASVSIAAQVITFPICIFYFHQFPNTFLLTNLLAVPLSSIILFAEIILIAFSWFPAAAVWIGSITYWLIKAMNYIIEKCDQMPYSLTDGIYATPFTTICLYGVVTGCCGWLLHKNKPAFKVMLVCLLFFAISHAHALLRLQSQQKIIIYNVAQLQAIDFVFKNSYFFKGDSSLLTNGMLQNFNLKPARIFFRLNKPAKTLFQLHQENLYWQFGTKKMIIIDSAVNFVPIAQKLHVDILLISKNPTIEIGSITAAIRPSMVVFDASNSLWKIARWKKQCEQLLLPCFSVPEKGAYILEVNND